MICLVLSPWSVLFLSDVERFTKSCAHGRCCFSVMEKALPNLVSMVVVVSV